MPKEQNHTAYWRLNALNNVSEEYGKNYDRIFNKSNKMPDKEKEDVCPLGYDECIHCGYCGKV